MEDVGEVVAGSVVGYFRDGMYVDNLEKLLELGVSPKWEEQKAGGPLEGMRVVITGTLPTLSRQEAEEAVARAGGSASSSVSARTSFVVAGEKAGSKLAKAQALGVEVIDEGEFLRRLGRA